MSRVTANGMPAAPSVVSSAFRRHTAARPGTTGAHPSGVRVGGGWAWHLVMLWAFTLTALVLAMPCHALTWRWSNPIPHGNNIVDMTWNGETAVQVTDLGQIYTGLGFLGWLPQNSGTTNTLQAVRYFGNRIV